MSTTPISEDVIIVVKTPGADMRPLLSKYNAFLPELEAQFKTRFFFCSYDYMENNLSYNLARSPQLRHYSLSRYNGSDRIELGYKIIDFIESSPISFPFPVICYLERLAQGQR